MKLPSVEELQKIGSLFKCNDPANVLEIYLKFSKEYYDWLQTELPEVDNTRIKMTQKCCFMIHQFLNNETNMISNAEAIKHCITQITRTISIDTVNLVIRICEKLQELLIHAKNKQNLLPLYAGLINVLRQTLSCYSVELQSLYNKQNDYNTLSADNLKKFKDIFNDIEKLFYIKGCSNKITFTTNKSEPINNAKPFTEICAPLFKAIIANNERLTGFYIKEIKSNTMFAQSRFQSHFINFCESLLLLSELKHEDKEIYLTEFSEVFIDYLSLFIRIWLNQSLPERSPQLLPETDSAIISKTLLALGASLSREKEYTITCVLVALCNKNFSVDEQNIKGYITIIDKLVSDNPIDKNKISEHLEHFDSIALAYHILGNMIHQHNKFSDYGYRVNFDKISEKKQ